MLLGAVVLAPLLLFVGVNGLLQTRWPLLWLNADPDDLHVDYRAAWARWPPFALHLEDLRVSFQDPETQVELRADTIDGVLSPWALRSLRLQAHDVDAAGVVFKLRPRRPIDAPVGPRPSQPDIAGFADLAPAAGERWPALITFALARVTLTDVKEVWVGDVRYAGSASISGSMDFEPRRQLALHDVVVNDRGGTFSTGPTMFVSSEALHARVDLEPFVFESADVTDFRKLTARLSFEGVLDVTGVAPMAVARFPGLRLSARAGPVSANLHVVKGLLQDRSRLSSTLPMVELETASGAVLGDCEVRFTATERARRVELEMHGAAVSGPDGAPWLDVEALTLVFDGATDLAGPDQSTLLVTAHHGRAHDLRFINQLLDPASGLSVVRGDAVLDATVAFDTVTKKASGALRGSVIGLELAGRTARLTGRALAKVHLHAVDSSSGLLNLDGSSFELVDATVFADRRRYDGFWLKVRLPKWSLWTVPFRAMTADVEVDVQHLQPVMGIVAAQVALPFPIRLMSEHPELSSSASIVVTRQGLEVKDLRVHAKALDVWADFRVKGRGVWGAALVKSPPVIAAIEFKGDEHDQVLSEAEAWFRQQRARQHGE